MELRVSEAGTCPLLDVHLIFDGGPSMETMGSLTKLRASITRGLVYLDSFLGQDTEYWTSCLTNAVYDKA